MTVVLQTPSATIYSKDIYVTRCVAMAGNKEWVGTDIGVKQIDHAKKEVTIFAGVAGLPLGRVEAIATDSTGKAALALVRRHNTQASGGRTPKGYQYDTVAVCLYNPGTAKWIKIDNRSLYSFESRGFYGDNAAGLRDRNFVSYYPLLATDSAITVPSVSLPAKEAAFSLTDRATGESTSVAWGEDIQADFNSVVVGAALLADERVYLGTNIGLFQYDLRTKTWSRPIATQNIYQMVVSPTNKDVVFLLSRSRRDKSQPLSVSRYSLTTGALLSPTISVPTTLSANPTLSVSNKNVPWLTTAEAFYTPKSDSSGWLTVLDNDAPRSANAPEAMSVPPSDAAILARILLPEQPYFGTLPSSDREKKKARWLRERFPYLINLDSREDIPLTTYSTAPTATFVADPFDKNAAWGWQRSKLVRVPRRLAGEALSMIGKVPSSATTFDLEDPVTGSFAGRIPTLTESFVAARDADDALILASGDKVVRYDYLAGSWNTLSPGNIIDFSSRVQQVFYVDNGTVPLAMSLSKPVLVRLTSHPDTETISDADSTSSIKALRLGLWDKTSTSLQGSWYTFAKPPTYRFLPLTADGKAKGGWQIFSSDPDLPRFKGVSHNENMVATGTIAWFRFRTDKYQSVNTTSTVLGYDLSTKRWIAPLEIPDYGGTVDLYFAETEDGDALVGVPNTTGSVFRYHPGDSDWKPVATTPIPAPKDTDFVPFADRNNVIYAATKEALYQYDAARSLWNMYPLPDSLKADARFGTSLDRYRFASTKQAVYVGYPDKGLWRFDLKDHRWSSIEQPVQWSQNSKDGAPYVIESIAPDKDAVWVSGRGIDNAMPILLRWDRSTKTSRVLTERETGFDMDRYSSVRVATVGKTVLIWRSNHAGLYRIEQEGTRFQRIGDLSPISIQHDPLDPTVAFLLTTENIYRYEGKTGTVTPLGPGLSLVPVAGSNTLTAQTLRNLVVTPKAVFVATLSGVFRFDRKTETWKLIPETESIAADSLAIEGNTLVATSPRTVVRLAL